MSFINPKVSIALCTHNGEKFLAQQLDTLVNQSYKNLEIIILDDNSTDQTFEILDNYRNKYSFINLEKNRENLGFVKNFEKAIKKCSGTYICLCDQDDIWDLSKIELMVRHIDNNILIYHNSRFIDSNGELAHDGTLASKYNMYDGESNLPFLLSNCISGHAMMFSKDLIPYLFPFEEKFYHDWWIAYVAANIGQIKYLDLVLVSYRQHTDSITDNFKLKSTKHELPKNYISVNLDWLKKCSQFSRNKNPALIKKAYQLFKEVEAGKNRLAFCMFIFKYFNLIFFINRSKKGILSRLNFARKIYFIKGKIFY